MKRSFIKLLHGLRPKKVKWQLVAGVALVHAVLMSFFVFDLVEREKNTLLSQFQQQSTFMAQTLSANSVSWVLAKDVSGLQELILSQRLHNELKYAFICTEQGQIIAHTDVKKIGQYLTDPLSLKMMKSDQKNIEIFNDRELLDIASRIESNGKTIGWVRLGFNTNYIYDNIHDAFSQGAFYTLFTILVGSLFALILGNSLTSRIRLLINATRSINPAESNQLFQKIKGDEVGDLMKNFNLMQANLNKQYTQSQGHLKRIETLAFYDPLTELPNRAMLEKNLLHTIKNNIKTHQFSAIILFDLDNFKTINDTHGHDVGDLLLQQISIRTQSFFAENMKVYRFGGDEFVVLIDNLGPNYAQAEKITQLYAQELQTKLTEPYNLSSLHYQSTVSLGFYIIAYDYEKPKAAIAEALKRADIALYAAKDNGRNQVAQFEPSMLAEIMENDALSHALQSAVDANELVSVIQPKFNMQTNQIIGGEILCRWQYQNTWIAPGRFIALAENLSLINTLTRNQITWLMAELSKNNCRDLEFSINLSPMLIFDMEFFDFVQQALKTYGIEAKMIKFEITEGVFINHNHKALSFMNRLKSIGFKISLDDFGTGFSSLSYLKNLPIDELKIDKAFVDELPGNQKAEAIAKTIIDLSQNLEIAVIAEGVETESQSAFLIANDCQFCQGFLYSRPLSQEAFFKLLSNQNLTQDKNNDT